MILLSFRIMTCNHFNQDVLQHQRCIQLNKPQALLETLPHPGGSTALRPHHYDNQLSRQLEFYTCVNVRFVCIINISVKGLMALQTTWFYTRFIWARGSLIITIHWNRHKDCCINEALFLYSKKRKYNRNIQLFTINEHTQADIYITQPQDLFSSNVVLHSFAASLLVSTWLAAAVTLTRCAICQGCFFLGCNFWNGNRTPYAI